MSSTVRYPLMTKGPYLRAYLWLLLTVCFLFTIVACNNSTSSDNAAKKVDAPSSSPALTSTQPPPPAATAAQPANTPTIDPNTPFPALSAEILDALIAEEPQLAKHREILLKAEREAIAGAINLYRLESKVGLEPSKKVSIALPTIALPSERSPWTQTSANNMYDFTASAYAADQSISGTLGTLQFGVVGWQMVTTFGVGMTENPPPPGKSKTTSYKEGEEIKSEITTSSDPGGTPTTDLTTKIQNPLYALDANSKASVTGILCPDASGKVTLNISLSSQGKVGKNGKMKYGRTLAVTATATVGDDGNTMSTNVQSKQPDEDPSGSQTLGTVALAAAERYWRNGNCVTINASSPGLVKPKATSKIPVTVVAKRDGSSVPAKVTATLTGGESVSPTVIPKTPGDLTHVAVDKDGASMTITVKATSRRGNASTDLTITTKGMVFKLDGGADEFHGTGIVCDFEKPFKVSGDGLTLTFTPSSKTSGTYKYSGKLHGFEAWGSGTYTVKYDGDNPVHVTAKGPGTVKTPMGDMTAEGLEEYGVSASQSGCPYDKLLLDQ